MSELTIAGDLMVTLLMAATSFGWPPLATGGLWITAGLFALVSIFFDDETPRGNPGIDYAVLAERTAAIDARLAEPPKGPQA
jgi:hypothetical protein